MENLYGFSEEQSARAPAMPRPLAPSIAVTSAFPTSSDANLLLHRQQVASHPLFPHLLHAYIDCLKVGATPEMAQLLAQIREENNNNNNNNNDVGVCQNKISSFFGADPELDNFMETYCNLLANYKSDLKRPFDEAMEFLNDMEAQLNSIICHGGGSAPTASNNITPPALLVTAGSSEKGINNNKDGKETIDQCKRINEDQELKDNLLRRYSGYISSLKHEFSKNKKKERLPKEAKQILLAWWNIHFKWPYPTDADKATLSEWTGLDQKQINNWFINQRKRHWKPSEEMQAAVLDGIYGPIFMSESD